MTTPKEILINAVDNYLIDRLTEFGFSFSKSSLKISRTKGDFKNEISFRGSKTNIAGQLINFQDSFLIYSSFYKKWHNKNFPNLPLIGAGYIHPDGENYWKNYNRTLQPSFGYSFDKLDHKVIMDDIYQNVVKVALPYFNGNDTWDKVAQNTNSDGILKLDALIISDRILDAREYCEKGIKIFYETYGDSIKGNALQILTYFKTRRDLIA